MAADRVDKLVKDYQRISDRINDLSYAEYSESRTRIGRPIPDIEVARVQPPQARFNLVLASSDATARRAELAEFWRETEGNDEMGQVGKFMIYHTRPEWIKSGAKIPDGEEFIYEYLINSTITLQLGYDRSKMASLLEALLALNHIIQMYKDNPDKCPIRLESDPSNSWARGDNYDKIIDSTVVVVNNGTENEWKGTPEQVVTLFRQEPDWVDWLKGFDSWKEEWVNHLESLFTDMVSIRMAEAVSILFAEIGTLIQYPTGIVPTDILARLTRYRTTILHPPGHGGYKPVYFNWTDDILRKFLAAYDGKYKGLLETAEAELRTLAKTHSDVKPAALTLYNKQLDQDIIRSLVNYLQDNGKYAANDLALEQAARFAGVPNNTYEPSSLRAKLTEARKLPPLDFNAGASNE